MSRLEELIQTLCPDGVEIFKLSTISEIKRGQRITKSELIPEGPYPVISGGVNPMGFTNDFNRNEKTITVAQYGTAGFVNWQTNKFWANDVCYTIYPDKKLINRYLYYSLLSAQDFIYTLVIDAVPAHLPQKRLAEIEIFVPPLPVQEEIVRILDTFTELETELEAELTARTNQYEHYRHDLIFHYPESSTMTMEMVMLGEICHYSKESIDASEIDKDSYVGVDNLLQNKQGKVASEFVPEKGRLIRYRSGDVLIGNIRPYLKKIWMANNDGGTNGDVLCIQINDEAKTKIIPRFLYQILSSEEFFSYAINFTRGAGMPRGSKEMTMKFKFAIPPLEIQEQIVFILDRFDTLVNDLKSGLPAEIALRRKQYEYYRDKLLTFTRRA